MIKSHKVHRAGRMRLLSMAMTTVAAAGLWALGIPGNVGVKGWFESSRQAFLRSERRTVAKVISVSGSASVLWAGRSRPLAAGNELTADEVVVTGVGSMVLVETADGGVYNIFPESRVRLRENRQRWLDQVDRWLKGIKTRIQSYGGPPPSDRLSDPTDVLSVRAASLLSPVRWIAGFANRWSVMRS